MVIPIDVETLQCRAYILLQVLRTLRECLLEFNNPEEFVS